MLAPPTGCSASNRRAHPMLMTLQIAKAAIGRDGGSVKAAWRGKGSSTRAGGAPARSRSRSIGRLSRPSRPNEAHGLSARRPLARTIEHRPHRLVGRRLAPSAIVRLPAESCWTDILSSRPSCFSAGGGMAVNNDSSYMIMRAAPQEHHSHSAVNVADAYSGSRSFQQGVARALAMRLRLPIVGLTIPRST